LQPEDGVIAVFKVAIDESGSHGDSPALCVAGCLADVGNWAGFCHSWRPRAAAYAERGFHATIARDADNAFLAELIAQWLNCFAVTVPYSTYKAVVPPKLRSKFGGEYGIGVRLIAIVFHDVSGRLNLGRMAYVLEAGHPGQGSARKFLDEVTLDPAWHVQSHTWVGKEEIITHAPDLVAHLAAAARAGSRSPLLDVIGSRLTIHDYTAAELRKAVKIGLEIDERERKRKERERALRRRRKAQ
jgi:hypothetical protein